VETAGEDYLPADVVVCNADALYALRSLLDPVAVRRARRFLNGEVSLAGFVLLLGVRKRFPALGHHNIFFSADYRAEFRAIFDDQRPAADPTVYVSVSSVTDPVHAPEGGSNMFVLVNAPAIGGGFRWEDEASACRDLVLRTLESHGLDGIDGAVETERMITPSHFARMYNAHRGAIYGLSSNSRMAAFLRPPNRWRGTRGLYFAGGSAHPGGGIPLVLLSGSITAELVHEDAGRS
jgi:phytoene desaturase